MSLLSFAPRWLLAYWGRKAFRKYHGVPYLSELSRKEHHGVTELERRGLVKRDDNGSGLHWHRRYLG